MAEKEVLFFILTDLINAFVTSHFLLFYRTDVARQHFQKYCYLWNTPDRLNDNTDIPHREGCAGAVLLRAGEIMGKGENPLLNYSFNDTSSVNPSLHMARLLQLLMLQHSHAAPGLLFAGQLVPVQVTV